MNLLHESKSFIRWTASVTKQFLRKQAGMTLFVVFATGASRIAKLLAFFLPLKVILLAGSDGVPRYFPFIDPAQKMNWIIALSIGAFVAYGLMLLLNMLTDRYSELAGKQILRVANQMSISAREDVQARKTFSDFTSILAGVGFIAAGAMVLIWVNPTLLAFLMAAPLLIFILSAWLVRGDALPFRGMKQWLVGNRSTYLAVASSIAFFGAFLVILFPLLFGENGNILWALLGIILSKQMLGSMSDIADTACKLTLKKPVVDAIVFRNISLRTQGQEPRSKDFDAFFAKREREHRAHQELGRVLPLHGQLQADWFDNSLRGIKTLNITLLSEKGGPQRYFQQQIVPKASRDQLVNEAHLFDHIPRERLKAPAVLTRFTVEEFQCQILDYGSGQPVPKRVWPEVKQELLMSILSVKPPKALISSYRRSRPMLADRFNDELMEHLQVAVDTRTEAENLIRWRHILPELRLELSKQPLSIYNQDLGLTNVVRAGEDYSVMAWGRWSLEPLGAALQMAGRMRNGSGDLEVLKERRSDLRNRSWQGDLELSALCAALEQAIRRRRCKRALSLIKQTLSALDASEVGRGAA